MQSFQKKCLFVLRLPALSNSKTFGPQNHKCKLSAQQFLCNLGSCMNLREGIVTWKFRNGNIDSNICQSKEETPLNFTEKKQMVSVVA